MTSDNEARGGELSISYKFKVKEHNREHKICPIMSTPDQVVPCQAMGCQLWTSVYTTEGNLMYGCTYELQSRLNMDGRVSA